MKVGIVYTATNPEAVKAINEELSMRLGAKAEIINYQDATILDEVCKLGYVTPFAAARLVSMFMQAVCEGVDAILSCCSSVGEVVDASQELARYTGVPIVRIDEEMCREAVRLGKRIGILATLPTTLEPTKNTVLRVAREMNRQVVLVDGFMENAFGIEQDSFKRMICDKVAEIIEQVDVILLAQGSMAYTEELLIERFKKPVLSSPRFGVASLAKVLEAKGILTPQKNF